MSDILQIQGINSKGFGMIPKLVMQDRRLTAQAKAIYSYFASYAGGGQTAFPSRAKIMDDLNMGKDKYYRHLNQLIQCGYITAEQEKNQHGQFRRNVYTLMTDVPFSPCPDLPCPGNKDTRVCLIMTKCPKHGTLAWGDIMSTNRRRYEISDEEWERVKDLLPPEHTGKPGRPAGDNRIALNGIL